MDENSNSSMDESRSSMNESRSSMDESRSSMDEECSSSIGDELNSSTTRKRGRPFGSKNRKSSCSSKDDGNWSPALHQITKDQNLSNQNSNNRRKSKRLSKISGQFIALENQENVDPTNRKRLKMKFDDFLNATV